MTLMTIMNNINDTINHINDNINNINNQGHSHCIRKVVKNSFAKKTERRYFGVKYGPF